MEKERNIKNTVNYLAQLKNYINKLLVDDSVKMNCRVSQGLLFGQEARSANTKRTARRQRTWTKGWGVGEDFLLRRFLMPKTEEVLNTFFSTVQP